MVTIDGYPIDVALTEEHSFPSEATMLPTESGADLTDHIRSLPEEISLECVVSDTPIGEIEFDETRSPQGVDIPVPSADAYQHLLAIRDARPKRLVVVETSLGVFSDMALIDLTVPRNKDTGAGLFFSATFRRVRIITNKRTRVRVATRLANGTGNGAKKRPAEPMRTQQGVLWRQGVPAGGPLPFNFEWAEVLVTDSVPSLARVNLSAAGFGEGYANPTVVLRYGSRASPRIASQSLGRRLAQFGRPGAPLTSAERQAFILDMERDKNAFAASVRQDPASASPAASPAASPVGPANKALPPGLENLRDRFSTPPPGPTFTPAGPTTTFPPGSLRGP